jgi:type IV fimbrial biogenesis protein FimT
METPHTSLTRLKGFTLVELMVTLLVFGILVAAAVPSFSAFIDNQSVKNFTYQLLADLYLARNEAVKRQSPVVLQAKDGVWSKGWSLVLPQDDADGVILKDYGPSAKTSAKVAINFPEEAVQFGRDGRTTSNNHAFILCDSDSSSDVQMRKLIFTASGRPRIELSGNCSD